MSQFNTHKAWLLNEFNCLYNSLEEVPENIGEWPREFKTHPQDVKETLKGFNSMLSESCAECALADIGNKTRTATTIDDAFYAFHILGHVLFLEIRCDMSHDSLVDIGHEEIVCSLFATVCCNRYFGMPAFTSGIVKELSSIFADNATAEQKEPDRQAYSAEERLADVEAMFDIMIGHESRFRQ